MKPWKGHQEQTLIMEISSSLEWDLLLAGSKTEIRSPHPLLDPETAVPTMVMLHHGGKHVPFILANSWQQELIELEEVDARAEGFDSLASFKRHWCSKTGSDHFSQFDRVWGYEFFSEWIPSDFLTDCLAKDERRNPTVMSIMALINSLYPASAS